MLKLIFKTNNSDESPTISDYKFYIQSIIKNNKSFYFI